MAAKDTRNTVSKRGLSEQSTSKRRYASLKVQAISKPSRTKRPKTLRKSKRDEKNMSDGSVQLRLLENSVLHSRLIRETQSALSRLESKCSALEGRIAAMEWPVVPIYPKSMACDGDSLPWVRE